MRTLARISALAVPLVASLVACGGPGLPSAGGGKLADRTFAGQNKCNPSNALRPFIVEWDATDQSSFQSYAASDVVIVKYEGCDLKPLDGCRDDSAKGSLGAYKPVELTSGGLEVVDIHDEGELYAKLPLGAATLSGRVQSGEKFHMEYYVSGTRTATRDKLFKKDLAKNPKCAGATHFVYAYNLGAFGLAATSALKGEVHGSYFGFGAGGAKSSTTSAEKKGGDLASCKGESAKETETCKVPIRLTLRELSEGDSLEAQAAKDPDSAAARTVTGELLALTDAQKRAVALFDSASAKKASGDGKGCVADLDQHDQLDPRPNVSSNNPASGRIMGLRAECLMLAGQCDIGKGLLRRAIAATKAQEVPPERIDQIVEATASQQCRGATSGPRDEYIRAMATLRDGGLGVRTKTLAECQAAFDSFMKLRTQVQRKDDDDSLIPEKPLLAMGMPAPACFARAGDCAAAFKTFKAMNDAKGPNDGWKAPNDAALKTSFEGLVPRCKGK